MATTPALTATAMRRTNARADYSRIWSHAPWQPSGATSAERDDVLWELACSMRAPTQARSRQLDRELANPRLASGYSYFAQIVAHDVSRHDPLAGLASGAGGPANLRRSKLALESLYDGGPRQAPQLYERADPALMRATTRRAPVGGKTYFDLARDDAGRALLADPRQEQNAILAQMHVAFVRANNALVTALRLRGPRADALEVHARARHWLVSCFQHVLFRDFLPRLLHPNVAAHVDGAIASAHRGERPALAIFGGASPYVSAEFAFAAFRFGHTLVREQYRMRPEGYLYDMTPASESPGWLERGGPFLMLSRPLSAMFAVDWRAFVDNEDVEPNRARRIGPRVAWSMGNMPRAVNDPPRRASLPYMTLRSGCAGPTPLVSGPTAARTAGLEVVDGAPEPLWCYLLCEAEQQFGGERLGLLGSTIVGETLVGLLLEHEGADLVRHPSWIPPLGETASRFTLRDLLLLGERSAPWIAERVEETASASI